MPLTVANKITIARILAVPFFVITMLYYSPDRDYLRYVALGIYLFAVASDILDGYLARSRGEKTDIGALLDPFADKILLVSSFICLYVVGNQFPVMNFSFWLVMGVISRDILLLAGSLVLFVLYRRLDIPVSGWGKAAMFLQSACVVGLLLQWSSTSALWYVALFFTVVSAFDYAIKGLQIFIEKGSLR